MKIAFLSYRGNMFCGGQGVYLYYLTRELAKMGHEITVLVGPPYPAEMPWARVYKIKNHMFWGDHKDKLPKPNPLEVFEPLNFYELATAQIGFFPEPFAFSMRALRLMAKLYRAGERFDIIHDVQSLAYGLLVMKAMRTPIISTVHHPLTIDREASLTEMDHSFIEKVGTVEFYPLIMQKFVTKRLDMIITGSVAGKKELVKAFGVKNDRVRVAMNGIDTELFTNPGSIKRDPDMLLFVGNAQGPQKGFKYLLEAMKLMPEKIKLTTVDDGSREYASGLVRDMGLENRVKFTGRIDDNELVELYSRTALTVVPSIYEGFGLPAAEANSCRGAVVGTSAGALPEVIEDGVTGILVKPRSAKALKDGITKLLGEPDTCEEMGRKGRERMLQLFTWKAIAEKTEEFYRDVREPKSSDVTCC